MEIEPEGSAERMSRYRRHIAGDHSQCLAMNCRPRRELECQGNVRMFAVAAFEELAERGIDARAWFGDGYAEARELADADLPDFLPDEPDSVHRLQARHAINTTGSQLFPRG